MEKKITSIGLELKEVYTDLDDMYMRGTLWSKNGKHENYEIVLSMGELIEWINKNKIIERHKKYINKYID